VATKQKSVDGIGVAVAARELSSGNDRLPAEQCLAMHRVMVRARVTEERTIKMSKSGEGYFWIGGPGEEAFNVALGIQVKKGEGPDFDFLHLHYRNGATLMAMGMSPIEAIRQMAMTRTDPHSMGRNFAGHFAVRAWNVVPVSSVVENQYVVAPGTAWVQKRRGGDAITIVTGGDAGTAEGDFASCLVWSSRPGNELPILIIVTNNRWGISTSAESQHGEKHTTDRARAFGIPGEVVDGNDPILSWHAIRRGMEHCRKERKPYAIEALVSRLHGHSSSSGAIRVKDEVDCIEEFEQKLQSAGVMDAEAIERVHEEVKAEVEAALEQATAEPTPSVADIYPHTYAPSKVDAVYPRDYTGLPGQNKSQP
jgi:2-oxoisovalerate dehydrogenase E1 component alpha subunit